MAKRRGANEGSIYQDNERWVAALTVGFNTDGKPKKRKERYDTRKEAAEALRRMQREVESGVVITGKQSVGEFLEKWLVEVAEKRCKNLTAEGYRSIVIHYLVPRLGKVSLDKLSPLQVQKMINELEALGLSSNTVRNIRAVLRRALNQAMTWGLVARNVAVLVSTPKIVQAEVAVLTQAQAQTLLKATKHDRFGVLYRVGLSLGLRRAEILGVRWQDIDLEAKTLRVVQTVQRSKAKGLIITSPKTKGSTRRLSLPSILVSLLTDYKKMREAEAAEKGPEWNPHGLVFISEVGTPIEPSNLTHAFKALVRKAELPNSIHLHSLRHSCASFLLAQDVSPRTVMEILGHTQISTTMNIYAHVFPDTMKDAAGKMDALLTEEDQQEENEAD